MTDCDDTDMLPLPKNWPAMAKRAILHAVSMASAAFVVHLERWANALSRRARALAEIERRDAEIAFLREEMRVKDNRMRKVDPENRPHYLQPDRLAILQMKAARGWSNAGTARRFLLEDPDTVARWIRNLHENGPEALTRIPEPVNRFPDFVRHLVRRLKTLCPAMGKVKIAQHLARAALHLAPTTVGRFLKAEESDEPADAAGSAKEIEPEPRPERVVTSKRPNHVAHVDMTVVPTLLGGFWFSITGTLPTVFPFCWWLVVLQDHFSRRIQGFELFKKEPASAMIRAFLDRAFEAVGAVPKHIVMDKGRQFDCDAFRAWCRGHGIKWRYGAAGKKGSIAVIERVIRTIKAECTRMIRVPFSLGAMRAELDVYVRWFNEHRPHTHLRGRTPNEVYFGRPPANEAPRLEPRLKYPRDACCASPQTGVRGRRGVRLVLEVSHFGGKRHLPVISIKPAA